MKKLNNALSGIFVGLNNLEMALNLSNIDEGDKAKLLKIVKELKASKDDMMTISTQLKEALDDE